MGVTSKQRDASLARVPATFRYNEPVRLAAEPRESNVTQVNVGGAERWLSLIGGGALIAYGLRRSDIGGLALAALGGSLVYRGATGHCMCYQALGINTAGHNPYASVKAGHGIKIEKSITIDKDQGELFRFWSNFENLPKVMRHLESVERRGSNLTHWVAKGPMGMSIDWDAEVITERENELIGWRSVEGSEIDTAGSVHFKKAPGGRGTEITVVLKYDPPAGKLGDYIARLFGRSAEQEIQEDLQRFKEKMEAGGIPTTVGQAH
jgi:uncharacterized membrane protein